MKLHYHGVSHERKPLTLEVTEGEIFSKYRGQSWQDHQIPLGLKPRTPGRNCTIIHSVRN